ncbi:MAG: Holliday junction branch migration protein RuvA [Eubacteriales bacterium]|nr:Holliday junction branch migration protein RuvA [Eubacteriales bacterium]
MIAYVKGIVADVSETGVVLDVGGIGYQITVSPDTAARVGGRGEEAQLFTYMYVREDQFALYGFLSRDELELFKKLITVSGIGPKGGLSILSVISADDLRFAILSGDAKAISRAPGIGKKTAERLILDLRDKLEMPVWDGGGEQGESTSSGTSLSGADGLSGAAESVLADAAEALVALGYARMDALKAVRKAAAGGASDTEALLKAALKYMV